MGRVRRDSTGLKSGQVILPCVRGSLELSAGDSVLNKTEKPHVYFLSGNRKLAAG